MVLINADGLIVGRLSSSAARKLLEGDEVLIINAEKAILSGAKATTLREYREAYVRGSKEHGPFYPKRPDAIIKRTIRGMLPYTTQRGKDAMARLRVYIGTPAELEGQPAVTLEHASVNRLSSYKYMQLGELSRLLGAKF